jgi:hypothetical protein
VLRVYQVNLMNTPPPCYDKRNMTRMKYTDPRRHAQLAQNVLTMDKDDTTHSKEHVEVFEFSDDFTI